MQGIMKDGADTTNGLASDVVEKIDGMNPAKDSVTPPDATAVVDSVKEVASSTMKTLSETPNGNVDTEADFKEVVKEIVLWQQPKLSGKILGFVVWLYYCTLAGGYTPVNLLCLTLMLRLVSVSGPTFIAAKLESSENTAIKTLAKALKVSADYIKEFVPFPTKEQVAFCIKSISASVEDRATKSAQALVDADNDVGKLKVVLAHLAVLMILTSILSMWNLFFLGAFALLTIPAVYSRHHEKIDPIVEKAKVKAQPHLEKAKAKGGEVYGKVKAKTDELAAVAVAKYNERFNKKGTKTE